MFIGILERKWSCHPTPPQANRHFLVDILPRIQRSLKCSDFDIVPVAKAILGYEHTLPSCTWEAICSNAPLAVHKTTWPCEKFCVYANLCFYAFVCLCVDGCMNMSVCGCICVFVCINTYKYICVTHRCKDAVLAACTGKAMCHRTVSCPAAAAAARGVKNAILNYL